MTNKIFKKIIKALKQKTKINKKFQISLLLLLLPSLLILLFNIYYFNKIFPGISIANIYVGGKTIKEAELLIENTISRPEKIILATDKEKFEILLSEIDFSYDITTTLSNAYQIYRSDNQLIQFLNSLSSLYNNNNLNFSFDLNSEKLNEITLVISEQLSIKPKYPEVNYENDVINIFRGESGKVVKKEKLKSDIINNLSLASYSIILIPFDKIDPTLSDSQVNNLKLRANKLIGKNITLSHENITFELKEEDILPFLSINNEYQHEKISESIDNIATNIDRKPQDAVFNFRNNTVVEFIPAKEGLSVQKEQLIENIVEKLIHLENSQENSSNIIIPVEITLPSITTEDVNNLGIKELLGRGSSNFTGSISSRIHNIALSSSKFNGTLVPPDEIFSFNTVLGDVSEYTGYKQAYIIKDGKTVLGDGGGVCQVSTTMFRAALYSGLPIVERRAHSYRVRYYEQDSSPGLDATVYSPTTDLKFKNDTPGHILIQTKYNPNNSTLAFEFYGTSDGRIPSIAKPVITETTLPPEDLYIDDPSLPVGTIKQTERSIPGAKVYFDYKVEKNGEIIIEKRFHSNFLPWQAVYLRGTGPVQ